MFKRRYFDEEDWEEISEETARKLVLKCYISWELVLEELQMGYTVMTNWAEIAYKQEETDNA